MPGYFAWRIHQTGFSQLRRKQLRLRTDPNPPQEWISLSLEKEVLNKRVRTGGLPPGYID